MTVNDFGGLGSATTMIQRLLVWLWGRRNTTEPTTGAQAVVDARERVAAESDRTDRAQRLATKAVAARERNGFADALTTALRGRP